MKNKRKDKRNFKYYNYITKQIKILKRNNRYGKIIFNKEVKKERKKMEATKEKTLEPLALYIYISIFTKELLDSLERVVI